jgi:hypothetical protein
MTTQRTGCSPPGVVSEVVEFSWLSWLGQGKAFAVGSAISLLRKCLKSSAWTPFGRKSGHSLPDMAIQQELLNHALSYSNQVSASAT